MRKEDIINYVIETPLNTNPAILEQMIDSIQGGNSDEITITFNVVGNDPSYSEKFYLMGTPSSGRSYITGLFQIDGHYDTQAEPSVKVSESPVSIKAKIIENSVDCFIGNGDEPISLDGNVTKTYNEEFNEWVCTITGDCTITAQGSR